MDDKMTIGNQKPMAETFFDDERIVVELLGPPSSTGLVRCLWNDKQMQIARNKVQLRPLNTAAKEMLK